MKYQCTIHDIEDENEVMIQINEMLLSGFVNMGFDKSIGENAQVEIDFYDAIKISECRNAVKKIERVDRGFSYIIYGILEIDKAVIHSVIDFEMDSELLYDYGYLDGRYVKLEIERMNFLFD